MSLSPSRLLASLALFSVLLASPALAESEYLSVSGGVFAVGEEEESANFGLEYRGMPIWYDLLPIAGVTVNTDGAVYGYVGANYDWEFARNWYLIPHAAIGLYEEGSSRDLGGVVEFRTGLELDYALPNMHRVGLSYNHISNSSVYDHNPGEENVMLHYSVPMDFLR